MKDKNPQESFEENKGGTASAKPKPRLVPKAPPPRLLPPWKVILHNDDVNEFEDVIKVIRQLTPLKQQEAFSCVEEAHKSGSALLLTTHQERAELYVEQFTTYKLTVTAEADR